jgi:hypothetical protein
MKKRNKPQLHAKTFEDILLEAIDEALSSLGGSPKTAIYFHLGEKFGIKKEEIPSRLEAFSDALDKVFGLGAKYLTILFMKTLNKKLNCVQELNSPDCVVPDFTFLWYVKMKKQQFEKSEKTCEMEILYYAEQQNKLYT